MERSDRVAAVHAEDTKGARPPVPTRRCQNNITESHRPEPKQALMEGEVGGGLNPQLPSSAGADWFCLGYLSLKLRPLLDFTTYWEDKSEGRVRGWSQCLAGRRGVACLAGDIIKG